MKHSVSFPDLKILKGRVDTWDFFDHQIETAHDKNVLTSQVRSCTLHALEISEVLLCEG